MSGIIIDRNCDGDCMHSKACDADYAERYADAVDHEPECESDDCEIDYERRLFACRVSKENRYGGRGF